MKIQYVSAPGSSVLEEYRYDAAAEDRVRVLLVESDSDDAQLVCEAFGAISTETTIDVVTDGEAALEFLRQRVDEADPVPDLVLLNLELPGWTDSSFSRQSERTANWFTCRCSC